MQPKFIIVCESAMTSKESNTLSLIGIFEQINVEGLPAAIPKFTVVTKFENGDGTLPYKVEITDPEGVSVAKSEVDITFGPNRKSQNITNFLVLPFEKVGVHKVTAYVNGETLLTTDIEVKIV